MALTDRAKTVSIPKMNLAEKLYIPMTIEGLKLTFKHIFRKKATIKFPEQIRQFAPVHRGWHVLKRDENGAERCVACGLCAVACPAEAITMVAAERKPGEEHLYREEKYAEIYEINMLRCIFCGLCEEACPKEAIFLTERIVPTAFSRGEEIFGKDKLVESVDERIDITKRMTPDVNEFKENKNHKHNMDQYRYNANPKGMKYLYEDNGK